MRQHTAGPWKLSKQGKGSGCLFSVWRNNGDEANSGYAQICHDVDPKNASLIAAAPDLLEQLQVAVNYFDKNNIDGQDLHVHEMRAALAKAQEVRP